MTTKDARLAHFNELWPAGHNATPWVATPDGSWTRTVGAGVNPDIPDRALARVPPPTKTPPAKGEASEGAVRQAAVQGARDG
jgi:hypothetical protein